jgi:hypothetical protein
MPLSLVILFGVFILSMYLLWILNRDPSNSFEINHAELLPNLPWKTLYIQADKAVLRVLVQMPPKLRVEATRVQYVFHEWAPADRPLLGVFMSFEPGLISKTPGPIILYLGNIYQESERHSLDFQEEVATTYLHELGHYFGLSEADLRDRGLG